MREEEYRTCLAHVVKFLLAESDGRPVQASYAERVGEMCQRVIDGETTQQAIENVGKEKP